MRSGNWYIEGKPSSSSLSFSGLSQFYGTSRMAEQSTWNVEFVCNWEHPFLCGFGNMMSNLAVTCWSSLKSELLCHWGNDSMSASAMVRIYFPSVFLWSVQENLHPWLHSLKAATLLFSFKKPHWMRLLQMAIIFVVALFRRADVQLCYFFQSGIKCPKPMAWKVFSVYQVLSHYQSCSSSFYLCEPRGDFSWSEELPRLYERSLCI